MEFADILIGCVSSYLNVGLQEAVSIQLVRATVNRPMASAKEQQGYQEPRLCENGCPVEIEARLFVLRTYG